MKKVSEEETSWEAPTALVIPPSTNYMFDQKGRFYA